MSLFLAAQRNAKLFLFMRCRADSRLWAAGTNTRMMFWFSLLQVRKALEARQAVTLAENYIYSGLSGHFIFFVQKQGTNTIPGSRKLIIYSTSTEKHHQQQKIFSHADYYLVQTDAEWKREVSCLWFFWMQFFLFLFIMVLLLEKGKQQMWKWRFSIGLNILKSWTAKLWSFLHSWEKSRVRISWVILFNHNHIRLFISVAECPRLHSKHFSMWTNKNICSHKLVKCHSPQMSGWLSSLCCEMFAKHQKRITDANTWQSAYTADVQCLEFNKTIFW